MINPFTDINWKPARPDLRKFALSLIIGFPIIATAFFSVQWIKGQVMPQPGFFTMLGSTGAAIGLVCLLIPPIARPLYYVWYALAACLGFVMANLIFTVLFYGIFTPMAIMSRLLGRDSLRLKWKRSAASHWQEAPPVSSPAQYFRQY